MRFRRTFGLSLMALVAATLASAQQPPNIGIAPVPLGPGPYIFDTAEQHAIRVDVVVRAGELYMKATLPMGDGSQSPDEFIHAQSASTGLPERLCRLNM